mgnify:FL=1
MWRAGGQTDTPRRGVSVCPTKILCDRFPPSRPGTHFLSDRVIEMGTAMNARYLTIQETANFLQLSERTVRRLIERGDLKPVRIGPTLVVRTSDLLPAKDRTPPREHARPLMTVHEVADRLNCAPADVRRLSQAGRLPTLVFGGSRRWLPDAVEALAAEMADDA